MLCRRIDSRYGKVKKFRDFIVDNNLTKDLLMNLRYDDIKDELKDYYFKKFKRIYEKNPNISKEVFLKIFSDFSISTYYYWKNKLKLED